MLWSPLINARPVLWWFAVHPRGFRLKIPQEGAVSRGCCSVPAAAAGALRRGVSGLPRSRGRLNTASSGPGCSGGKDDGGTEDEIAGGAWGGGFRAGARAAPPPLALSAGVAIGGGAQGPWGFV